MKANSASFQCWQLMKNLCLLFLTDMRGVNANGEWSVKVTRHFCPRLYTNGLPQNVAFWQKPSQNLTLPH